MNGYLCFYNQKSIEVYAISSYEAQQKAVAIFKVNAKNSYKVSVHLCERDNKQEVIHTADF
jgi:hypothetical protein